MAEHKKCNTSFLLTSENFHGAASSNSNTNDNYEVAAMPHNEAMQFVKDSIAEIIIGDPLLNDLHTSITLEELNSYISLEHGHAKTVNVQRADGVILPIVVHQNATVSDLKRAFQRYVTLKQERENHTSHISWKHIWKSYWFYFNGQKLTDNNRKLKEYGISNKDVVTFIKRLKRKDI